MTIYTMKSKYTFDEGEDVLAVCDQCSKEMPAIDNDTVTCNSDCDQDLTCDCCGETGP